LAKGEFVGKAEPFFKAGCPKTDQGAVEQGAQNSANADTLNICKKGEA
jgi:hypothetical protein